MELTIYLFIACIICVLFVIDTESWRSNQITLSCFCCLPVSTCTWTVNYMSGYHWPLICYTLVNQTQTCKHVHSFPHIDSHQTHRFQLKGLFQLQCLSNGTLQSWGYQGVRKQTTVSAHLKCCMVVAQEVKLRSTKWSRTIKATIWTLPTD